ncbi:MAG: fatty acid desaturase [Gemmatimonadetes bacterium]|nr:fatty acid desaturase [Gemmatimonadota bacterium]
MLAAQQDFAHSNAPEPHRDRTKEILRRHPEIRELIGPNPTTFWWTAGIVAFQLAVAAGLADAPWWLVFVAAYVVGAFANHALFVIIHECTHRLVFRKKTPNALTGLFANLPLFFPSSVSFAKYHLKHHAFQGVYELDADLPSVWEAKLVGHSALGKALWLLVYPVVQMTRPWRLREIAVLDGWTVANWATQVTFDVAVALLLGPKALVYFAASLLFSIGLHPLGARWIQRHYMTVTGEQETFSYYGPMNRFAFNVGHHNEHHDFPSVAWDRLPRIRAIAPEYYNTLSYHDSWTRLLLRFLFDQELSLFSRMVRNERNRVALNDEVRPDVELINKAG